MTDKGRRTPELPANIEEFIKARWADLRPTLRCVSRDIDQAAIAKAFGVDDPGWAARGRCQINWRPLIAARRTLSASSNLCREGPPLSQSDQTSLLVNLSGDEMTFQIEMVLNLVVN